MNPAELPIPGSTLRCVDALPATLAGGVRVGPYSSARPGALLRVVPGVGRFLARQGSSVEYAPEAGADPAAIEALIHGGVLGALVHQRGELPLHATTLVAPGGLGAVALAGHSGAGKSTTGYELIRRGWTLLADDLTRITASDEIATAWPGRTRLRLMSDACARFRLDTSALEAAPNWPGKYQLRLPAAQQPAPLAALITIARSAGPLRIERLGGGAATAAFVEHTYRRHYVAALGCVQRHFALVTAAARLVPVVTVRGEASVQQVADAAAAAMAAVDQHG